MRKRMERWAVIFNLYGPQTIAEGLVCCAWEAPPETYNPEDESKAALARLVQKALEKNKGENDAAERAVAAYGITPPGCLRLGKGQELAVAKGKAVVLLGHVALCQADLTSDPDHPAERVYVRVPDDLGGHRPYLYPAELGTHAQYLARYERFASGRVSGDRPVLWSTPSPPLPVAA